MQDDELFYESDSIETVLSAFTSIYSGTTVGSLAVIAFVSLEYASFYYCAPGMRAEYCIEHACLSVCLSVSLAVLPFLCLSRWLAVLPFLYLSGWLAVYLAYFWLIIYFLVSESCISVLLDIYKVCPVFGISHCVRMSGVLH